jgi:hypothetical protein
MEIGRLSGISYGEASDLRSQGIRTVEALEARVALLGLPAAVQGRLASPGTIREALAQHALREAEGETRPLALRVLRFPRTNWLDVAVAVLLALAVAGVARAILRPERSVVAVRDLAAFQVIGPADVEVRSTAADFGVFAAAEDAVGRFPLQVVPAGGALRRDRLSRIRFPRPEELAGRRILTLPVAPHALALARPGTRVAVLLVPGDSAGARATAGSLVEDVMVLNAGGAGDTASLVVAVREAALPALRSLGSSQAIVLQQVALPPAGTGSRRGSAAPSSTQAGDSVSP